MRYNPYSAEAKAARQAKRAPAAFNFDAALAAGFEPDASDLDEAQEEALTILTRRKLQESVGGKETDEHTKARRLALALYLGAPYGNELEGFSQWIDRTCMDVVEEALPTLVKVFHGVDEPVQFTPNGAGQEEMCEQATAYASHVYMVDNPGFQISLDVLKSGLQQGIGAWLIEWRETWKVDQRRASGLTRPQVESLAGEEGVEVLGLALEDQAAPAASLISPDQEEELAELGAGDLGPMLEGAPPEPLYSVLFRRRFKKSGVHVESIAPEDLRYESGAYSARHCTFWAIERLEAKADLVAEGFDEDIIAEIPAYALTESKGDEASMRRGEEVQGSLAREGDESMQLILVSRCYIRTDADGDGIAEWRRVILGGNSGAQKLIAQEMIPDHPIVTWSPIPMPFALEGMGLCETVADIQSLKTEIMRQTSDGHFESNNPTLKVKVKSPAWSALLNRQPGKPIPVNEQDDVEALAEPWDIGRGQAFLTYADTIYEKRTGMSATRNGTNPDLLKANTLGQTQQVLTAAQERAELIVRIAAETGFAPLFMKIHRLTCRHQERERVVKMGRNFVPMNPADWDADLPVSTNVGLGTGDQSMQIQVLKMFLEILEKALAAKVPIADFKNLFEAIKQLARVAKFKNFDLLFTNPDSPEGKELAQRLAEDPSQSPEVLAMTGAERIKAQAKVQTEQMKDDRERDKMEIDLVLGAAKLTSEPDLSTLEARRAAPRDGLGNPEGAPPVSAPAPAEPRMGLA